MADLRLTLSCGYYDRTLPVLDGRVRADGIDLVVESPLTPGTSMGSPDADVYEVANPALVIQRDRGAPHLGLPIFPRRKFFHQLLLTRTDSKISSFPDFVGKKIGVLRWYQHALGVWLRGHLKDQYGIHENEIHWFAERENQFPMEGSAGVKITVVDDGKGLAHMLLDGELDVVGHENAHNILLEHRELKRVFPNFKEVEAAYFKETGVFPINHALAIKKRIVEQHPWVTSSLVRAFETAKRVALDALDRDNSLLSTPWIAHVLEDQYRFLKRDMFPYGLEANRRELETHVRYLHGQHLISRLIPLDEIYARETDGLV